jgi:hypothetical protein
MEKANDLLTINKIAEQIEDSPAKVKKIIAELDIEPDSVKCNCKYFAPEKVEIIKQKLAK